jgi:triosephosphate isomerase
MRRNVIIGNWKMHGSVASVTSLVETIIARGFGEKADCFFCPSFVHVKLVSDLLNNASSAIKLGAQDLSDQEGGAFTGEVSGLMLADLGVDLVLVGHSERRHRLNETDDLVSAKYKASCAVGLSPVLCVGETQAERENGDTEEVVGRQLKTVIDECGLDFMRGSIVAYEPVWAIGTGLTATPGQAQSVHAFLRETLRECSPALADETRLIYGGSVKADNATQLFEQRDIDGALVGGASLDAEQFLSIWESAER